MNNTRQERSASNKKTWSSLIYNTSARQKRHQRDTSETRGAWMQHKCDMSATRTARVGHECYTNDTSAKWVKKFDFDYDTSKNVFSHPFIYYMASERL